MPRTTVVMIGWYGCGKEVETEEKCCGQKHYLLQEKIFTTPTLSDLFPGAFAESRKQE